MPCVIARQHPIIGTSHGGLKTLWIWLAKNNSSPPSELELLIEDFASDQPRICPTSPGLEFLMEDLEIWNWPVQNTCPPSQSRIGTSQRGLRVVDWFMESTAVVPKDTISFSLELPSRYISTITNRKFSSLWQKQSRPVYCHVSLTPMGHNIRIHRSREKAKRISDVCSDKIWHGTIFILVPNIAFTLGIMMNHEQNWK